MTNDQDTSLEDGAFDDDAPGPLAEAYSRALALEKAGQTDAAVLAWQEVLALDPADRGGAAVRLAAMGRAEAPGKAPDAYVALLFNQHADAFDDILVDQLGYAAPDLARERVEEVAPGRREKMLDLGCGTGLAGLAFADMTDRITGVDLSERMLERTDARELYEALYLGEAVDFLTAEMTEGEEDDDPEFDSPWDLIVATDVLPYLGDPAALLAGCARHMPPGGLLVFTTETLSEEVFVTTGRDWMVGADQRFAHRGAAVVRALEDAGFAPLSMELFTVRTNQGRPEPGHMIIARRLG
ncbi:MAG: putative TPR repeat methyltransferase [Paracoccaceae bacterium]|jgi:predicted TPR repeat methyltransferase